jgi:hypothetical protein
VLWDPILSPEKRHSIRQSEQSSDRNPDGRTVRAFRQSPSEGDPQASATSEKWRIDENNSLLKLPVAQRIESSQIDLQG